jgi:heterodisulfide reductase subunit B
VGQIELREQRGEDYDVPAIHYIQLLAIAMGMDVDKSGLVHHNVVTAELVEKLIQGEIME